MFERGQHSILVVDDSPAARYAMARHLRASGYRTVEASSGAEALELAEFVSAVVLDVHLPDVHGFEVCRLLRSRPRTRGLLIVHVSAIAISEADKREAASAGANGYLVGPVDGEELATTFDRLLTTFWEKLPGDRSGSGTQSILDDMTRRERLVNPGEAPQRFADDE